MIYSDTVTVSLVNGKMFPIDIDVDVQMTVTSKNQYYYWCTVLSKITATFSDGSTHEFAHTSTNVEITNSQGDVQWTISPYSGWGSQGSRTLSVESAESSQISPRSRWMAQPCAYWGKAVGKSTAINLPGNLMPASGDCDVWIDVAHWAARTVTAGGPWDSETAVWALRQNSPTASAINDGTPVITYQRTDEHAGEVVIWYADSGGTLHLGSSDSFEDGELKQICVRIRGKQIQAVMLGVKDGSFQELGDATYTWSPALNSSRGISFGLVSDDNENFILPNLMFGSLVVLPTESQGTLPVHARVPTQITVCGGNVFYQQEDEDTPESLLSEVGLGQVSVAQDYDQLYIAVEGATNIWDVDTSGGSAGALIAEDGTAPVNPKLCCNWRGRIVVVTRDEPNNIYASRAGDPLDWDYGQEDAQAAFALNDGTEAGKIGLPITALIVASNDVLIVGGEKSIWCLQGDPMDGGSVQDIVHSIGVISQSAWCRISDGSVIFVSQNGLYQISSGAMVPVCLSGAWSQFFTEMDRSGQWCLCGYDRDREAVLVIYTPTVTSGDSQGLYYDIRTRSCWAVTFPYAIAPTCVSMDETSDPQRRQLVFGCRDGYVRYFAPELPWDDGNRTIESYFWFGPLTDPDMSQKLMLSTLEVEVAAGSEANLGIYAGNSYPEALTAMPAANIAIGPAAANRNRSRVRGQTIALRLTATALRPMLYERGSAEVTPGGMRR